MDEHKYITIAKISLDDFIDIVEILNDKSKRKRNWVHLILTNQLICPSTNKKVAYCGFDKFDQKNGNITFHFNFYDKNGMMFTIDHKLPLSKGGKNWVDNIQPMICFDNWNKSNKLIFL